jgi:hypothetical protein
MSYILPTPICVYYVYVVYTTYPQFVYIAYILPTAHFTYIQYTSYLLSYICICRIPPTYFRICCILRIYYLPLICVYVVYHKKLVYHFLVYHKKYFRILRSDCHKFFVYYFSFKRSKDFFSYIASNCHEQSSYIKNKLTKIFRIPFKSNNLFFRI